MNVNHLIKKKRISFHMRPFLLPYLKLKKKISVCGNVNAESPIDQSHNFLSTWFFICTKNYKTQYIALFSIDNRQYSKA